MRFSRLGGRSIRLVTACDSRGWPADRRCDCHLKQNGYVFEGGLAVFAGEPQQQGQDGGQLINCPPQ